MFQELFMALAPTESLQINVTRAGDRLRVVLIPRLDPSGAEDDSPASRLRARLAMPLVLLGSPEELDATFNHVTDTYGAAKAGIRQQLAAFENASKTVAAVEAAPAQTPPPGPVEPDAAETEQPPTPPALAPPAPSENLASLF